MYTKFTSMKKLIVALVLLFIIAVSLSACRTYVTCDAYEHPAKVYHY